MLIKTVSVKNFRCARNGVLNCEKLTALVGANGSGKSTFLRALHLFYEPGPKLDQRDWYNEDQTEPIEIAITFSDLGPGEKERFGGYLEVDELTVERVFSFSENKVQHKYFGSRLGVPEFKTVRVASNAAEAKKVYQTLIQSGKYEGLPNYGNKEQALGALREWEQAHLDQCCRGRDDGQFFGFTEVAQGYLADFTRLIYVPAVRDAGSDADEGKDSPVKEIVDLVVRNSLAAHKSILALKEETKKKYEEIVDPSKLTGLRDLQDQLNRTLGAYVVDAKVELDWLPSSDVQLALPKTDVTLSEDGYPCTVSRSGHGLQRAFILTMLQHFAVAKPIAETIRKGDESEKTEAEAEAEVPKERSDLILCIEEPEVYQHPNRQRHFSSLLLKLANGTIEGVARKTQVIYSTHSPMFVGLDRFDQVRLFRKTSIEKEKPKCAKLSEVTMNQIAEQLWVVCGSHGEKYTAETLLARLQPIMTPWMNEGFFADVVVLVEGEDDLAAILGVARSRDVSLEALGISVIPCMGKTNLDRPALIFRALGIPIYLVWDSDKGDDDTSKTNRLLLRLVGEPETDFPSGVKDTFACFEVKLEITLKAELGAELFDEIVGELQKELEVASPKDCLKKPAVVGELIRRVKTVGSTPESLELILDRILALQEKTKPN
jgi:putative ATP-dependent endonuclease of the OLD family